MTEATGDTFIYVTFVRKAPQKVWSALTDPAIMKQYWFGTHQECDWRTGSPLETGVPRRSHRRQW